MVDMEETIKATYTLYIMIEREREREGEAVVNDFEFNFCLIIKPAG